jgi:hypothetical protein
MEMTNLKKIIDKAVSGGFNLEAWFNEHEGNVMTVGDTETIIHHMEIRNLDEVVIFSHDFLKAFFGEEELPTNEWSKNPSGGYYEEDMWYRGGGYDGYGDYLEFKGKRWQYHAQQLVLSEDRNKYLMDYMEG